MTSHIWPLGKHTIDPLPDHPALRQVGEALAPLMPLLRKLNYDFSDAEAAPQVVLGLGAEFHLIGVRLLEGDTLLIDLPVGELNQTPANLQKLLSDNLHRTWPFRVDSVLDYQPAQVVVVIEYLLPLQELQQLADKVLEGWMTKSVDEGLLHFLNTCSTAKETFYE